LIYYYNYSINYYLAGSSILTEITGSNRLDYYYDEVGMPYGFKYNWSEYFYIKNLQGDVICVTDSSGAIIVKYTYDPRGAIISITDAKGNDVSGNSLNIGNINPFRYRSYYYDRETGMYYLNSKYYDPMTCRFINADNSVLTGGSDTSCHNMFSYGENNPIMNIDPTGAFSFKNVCMGIGIGIAVVGVVAAVVAVTGATAGVGTVALAGGVTAAIGAAGMTEVAALGGAMIVGGTVMATTAYLRPDIQFSKESSKSGKERSTDKPSWVNKDMVNPSLSAQQNATNMLNNKYGNGNWKKGGKTEFNEIVKWITRALPLAALVPDDKAPDHSYNGSYYWDDEYGNCILCYYVDGQYYLCNTW
jgi:RHS repeat-associated protein